MKIAKFFGFINLALYVLFLASVSDAANLKRDIIGKWVSKKGESFEFLKSETVIVVFKNRRFGRIVFQSASQESGNYKFIDDNRLKVTLDDAGSEIFEVFIDKEGRLNLREQNGEVSKYFTEKAYKAEKEREKVEQKEREKKARLTFSDLIAIDKKTGLMWTRNAAGWRSNWNGAIDYIGRLNKQKYAGYTDWRLPSKEELGTLIDYAKGKGYKIDFHEALSKVGFENVKSRSYWTSNDSNAATWVVDMSNGSVGKWDKGFSNYVWPIRAGHGTKTTSEREQDEEADKSARDSSSTAEVKTASLGKQDAEAYIKSATAYYKNEQYDKAIEDYSKAIAINPNIPEVYNNRGLAYHMSEKFDKAIEDYNKTIAMNPNLPVAHYNIAASYSLLGKEAAACDSLNKAIEKGLKNLKSIEDNTDFDKIRNSNCYKEVQSKIRNEKTKNFFKGLLNNPK